MKRRLIAVLFVFSVLISTPGTAQVGDELLVGHTCSYFGEILPEQVTTFSSDQEAENVISRILDVSGLSKNFEIKAAGVPNAAAVIQGSVRYILYNQYFMQQTRQATGSQWGPVSIMAHEVGHHLNGHTLDQLGSRPKLELEADYFSGFILQKLGASLDQARLAMDKLGSPTTSPTHPAKHNRLAAITNGWKKSCDSDPNCRGGTTEIPNPPPTIADKPPLPPTGPDSCEYASDGECDEPELCQPGTDTTDCRTSRRIRAGQQVEEPITPPPPESAHICVTPAGPCRMMVAVPRGIVCTCFTPYGPIAGISQ